MAYAISKKSIFRRCLVFILCICLFICTAIPAFAFPVILPGADPVSVSWNLAAASYLAAIGYSATDDDDLGLLTGGLLDDAITAGIANADGTLTVTPSNDASVYFISPEFINWYNRKLANEGFFLNASFVSEIGLLSDGMIIEAAPYEIYQFIGDVPCGLDQKFFSWWNDNAGAYFDKFSNAPFCGLEVDALGVSTVFVPVVNPDYADDSTEFYLQFVNFNDELGQVLKCRNASGDCPFVYYRFDRHPLGYYEVGIRDVDTLNLSRLTGTNASQIFEVYNPKLMFGSIGTWSIDPYSFIPPLSAPNYTQSNAVNFPEWNNGAAPDGSLPLNIPTSVSGAITQPSDVAQGAVPDDVVPQYGGLLNTIIRLLQAFMNTVSAKIGSLAATIVAAADALGLDVAEWGQNIVDKLSVISNQINFAFNTLINQSLKTISDYVANVSARISDIYNWTVDFFDNLAISLSNVFSESLESISGYLETLVYEIDEFWNYEIEVFWTLVHNGFVDVIQRLKDWYDAFIEWINSFFANLQAVLEGVLEAVIEAIEQLPKGFRDWKEKFKGFLADGFGFTNIWHYVTSWIGCISGFVGQILAIWSKLPYCMVVPVYACVTLTIVFGLYRRFIR